MIDYKKIKTLTDLELLSQLSKGKNEILAAELERRKKENKKLKSTLVKG